MGIKFCEWCGREFVPNKYSSTTQRYCTADCLNAARNKQEKVERKCIVCGKSFLGKPKRKFCSKECRARKQEQKNKNLDRELEQDTPYLCQKWRQEGESIKKIASTLSRSEKSVKKALAVKLTRVQLRTMEEHFIPCTNTPSRRSRPATTDLLEEQITGSTKG